MNRRGFIRAALASAACTAVRAWGAVAQMLGSVREGVLTATELRKAVRAIKSKLPASANVYVTSICESGNPRALVEWDNWLMAGNLFGTMEYEARELRKPRLQRTAHREDKRYRLILEYMARHAPPSEVSMWYIPSGSSRVVAGG